MPAILDTWTVQPHGPLEKLDEGILTVAGEIVMPLGRFPRRMTVLRLAGGGSAVWSAIALGELEMKRIEGWGEPKFLIVPNQAHRLDSRIWKRRYPAVRVIAPPGARSEVEQAVPVEAIGDVIHDPDVTFHLLEQKAQEFALTVRRPGGTTLIVNDCIAHVRNPDGPGAWIMARLMGFGVKGPQVPRVVRRMMIDDPKGLAEQFRAWAAIPDLKRIVVSHGEPIEDDPAGVLLKLADGLA